MMKNQQEWFHMTIPSEWEGMTIDKIIKKKWNVPRRLRHDFRSRRKVLLNGTPPHWKTAVVHSGDDLALKLFEPSSFRLPAVDMNLEVLFEDDHLLVVNKPAGVFTHPNSEEDQHTLWNGVAYYCEQYDLPVLPKYIHRLDRHTSGGVLFGKHPLAVATLGEMMKKRQIKRTYIAKVHGLMENDEGVIDAPIDKDPSHTTRRMVTSDGKKAVTTYVVLNREDDHSLLRLHLETGRTHQIRVHLSHIGHPLIGDSLYGGHGDEHGRQALHAAVLSFPHPFREKDITCISSTASTPFFEEKDLTCLKTN